MTSFRKVTEDFFVAPQIALDDVTTAVTEGFTLLIGNRPDDEEPGQPSASQFAAAAEAAGLDFVHIPVRGGPTPEQVDEMRAVIARSSGPVLAFCRSGTRSIVTWSIGQALSGERSPADLIALGGEAGYDLSSVLRR